MAKAKLEEGITDAHAIVDSIHAAIADHTPLWKGEIADIVSGFGEKRKATRTELQERLSQLRRDLKDAYHPKQPKKGKTPDEEAAAKNERRQKEIRKQIAKIDAQIKSGDFSKAPARAKPEYNEETRKLQSELDHARADADRLERKIAYKAESPIFRAITFTTTLSRAMILFSLSVFEHLAGASLWRAVSTVAEDTLWGGIRHAFPTLDRLADLEGGGAMAGGQLAGLKKVFSRETLKMMKDKWVQGRSDRQAMYGKHYESNYPLLDLIGRSHDIVKTPLEQHEYGRATYRQTQNLRRKLARDGATPDEIDRAMVTDSTQAYIGGKAYEASQAAKLQGKNAVADWWNDTLRRAENSGDLGALFAGLARIESPIVKIPLNYAGELFSYFPGGGALKAGSRAMAATRKGRKLTPEDANYIVKNIKKQSLGAGLFAAGFFGYQYFGGLWRPGKKPPNEDLPIGDIQTPLGVLSHHWSHSPTVGMMQMGATVAWAMEEDRKKAEKGGGEETPWTDFADGVAQSISAAVLDVPVFQLPQDLGDLAKGGSAARRFLGAKARQFIPSELQQYARRMDVDDEGEPIKRKPTNFVEELKVAIPGYREEVPEAVKRKSQE